MLVTQHELDMAKPGPPESLVDGLLRRSDRGAVRGGRAPVDLGDGQPEPVAPGAQRHPGIRVGSLFALDAQR